MSAKIPCLHFAGENSARMHHQDSLLTTHHSLLTTHHSPLAILLNLLAQDFHLQPAFFRGGQYAFQFLQL